MKIRFLGGVRAVTGTCFYLETSRVKMLVDCGMFQGEDADEVNRETFGFDPSEIDYLFLTHAHIDHSGLIPRLARDGFKGRIVTTSATADLAALMLHDSAHIQEADAEALSRKALRAGKEPQSPPYTVDDVKAVIPLFKKMPYGKIGRTGEGVSYRFLDAGHILGSGTLELWIQDGPREKKIVFSGDIGRKGNPIINDPSLSTEADCVVMESTYGNRLHKGMGETIDELVEAIKITFRRGGNVIIPAFSIGRTQDLLYILNRLVREGRLYNITVYVDSPLAEEATKTYLAHPECFDEEAKRLLGERSGDAIKLRFTQSVQDSMALNKIRSQAIIIAGSGMCDGGRVRHHLKHNLWRPECSIVFVGFQAKGTLGGFSAHADQKELLDWLSAFKDSPQVFIVHGEEETSLMFSGLVRERYGFVTHVPSKGDTFEL